MSDSSLPRPWLAPLSWVFGAAAAARVAAYRRGWLRRVRLAGPVVSVGNLAVGGSGKTPMVAWIACELREAGAPVAILSRGWGGDFRGAALVVSDGRTTGATASQAGDEPVMLARELPGVVVAVGPRRDVVGRAVEARFGPCVHVLDDGFQHLCLERDLDLVCVDARRPGGWPLPAGWLREFPGAAARADLVLLTGAERASRAERAAAASRFGPERCVAVETRRLGVFAPDGSRTDAPRRPFVVSGIARPERFLADVRAGAGEPAAVRTFPDHYRFSADQVAALHREADAAGADAVLITAKDAVRWDTSRVAPGSPPTRVLRIAVAPADPERLRERLRAVVARLPAAGNAPTALRDAAPAGSRA